MDIHEKFSGRLGEIIANALGHDDVKKIFDAAAWGDSTARMQITEAELFSTKPESSFLEMKLALLDEDIKYALLIAQAAERTLQTLERIETIPGKIKALKIKAPEASTDYLEAMDTPDPYYAKEFRTIGSADEPHTLRHAQAVNALTQIYERNEIIAAVDTDIRNEHNPMYRGTYSFVTAEDKIAIKKDALASYARAGETLALNGYPGVAQEIQSYVALENQKLDAMVQDKPLSDMLNRFRTYTGEIEFQHHKKNEEISMHSGISGGYRVPDEYRKLWDKIENALGSDDGNKLKPDGGDLTP